MIPPRPPLSRRHRIRAARLGARAGAALAALLLALAARAEAAPLAPAGRSPAGLARVLPGAAARITSGGALLEIDAASVDTPMDLEVRPLTAPETAPLDAGMTNVTGGGGAGYRCGPHGARFRKSLRLSLPYDERRLPPGMTADDIQVFFFDESLGHWVPLAQAAADSRTHTVQCLTDHFTDFIAATLVTPAHPDLASFVPTTMADMKAAAPGDGIDLIPPPEPNSSGDASLSYPIELPPGRNGVQPSLALEYHSGGGNGWLGAGWTLQVPEITVDTRWGVPRYGVIPDASGTIRDQHQETESYLLDGEELTPLAHRSTFVDRLPGDRTFHPRVEGRFDRVVRHGDGPSSFWWEVIDRGGVRSIYGEPAEAGGGPGTLRDDAGNIFRWALREVRDPHGNTMRFDYDLVSDPGIPGGTVPGRQLYLSAIEYTGRSGAGGIEPGAYRVRFLRDSDPSLEPRHPRHDIQIDCRGGFKMVTGELLRRIRVELDGDPVREYDLGYQEGAFQKTLLASIRVLGADGQPFPGNEHRFTYHDDVRDASGAYSGGFGPEANWTVPFDGVTLCSDLGPLNVCPDAIVPGFERATALSGAITHGVGGHSYIGLNCGLPTKENSIGLKVGFNLSRTDSWLGLLDVNGDGLPDKLVKTGSGFVYRENLARPGGSPAFAATTRSLAGLGALSVESSVTATAGAESYLLGITAIANGSGTMTVGTAYSTDANGDGFPDFVKDGQILFGRPGPGGAPVYETSSAHTPMPLAPGTTDGAGLIQDYEPLFQDLLDQHPLLDVFRRWLAPFDGTIRIQGGVRLHAPSQSEDGVRVSIQRNEDLLWSETLPAGDAQTHAPAGVEQVAVARGDRLYFRVQSVFEGSQDAVDWDPEIAYLNLPPAPDANGLDAHHYLASADFVLGGRAGEARMPAPGQVRVTGVLEKPDTTSDDVTLVLERNGADVFRTTMPWDSTGEVSLDVRFSVAGDDSSTHEVDEADRVHVALVVDSPIDTRRVHWRPDAPPELVYETVAGAPKRTLSGDPLVSLLLPSDIDLYPATMPEAAPEAWEAPHDGTISVTTALGGGWSFRDLASDAPVSDGALAFTVKRAGVRLARGTILVRGGKAQNDTLSGIAVAQGDRLFFDFSARNLSGRGTVAARVRLSGIGGTPVDAPCALHTNVDFDDVAILGRGLFSQPHRGWGYAGYNGNPARDDPERPHACSGTRVAPTAVIHEADLVFDQSLAYYAAAKQPEAAKEAVESQKAYAFSPVFERLADGSVRASWRGPDESGWVEPSSFSSTRLGVHLVGVPCASDLGSSDPGADHRAVPRIGTSVNAGVAAGYVISVGGSVGRSSSEVDFFDMNGDQFPDVVGNGRVQYTLPNGGLEVKNRDLSLVDKVRYSDNLAGSVSLGGTVPRARGGSRGKNAASSKSAPRDERTENSMPSLGFSGDLGIGSSTAKAELIDLNGDALPDRVFSDGTVALNLGYRFATAETWPGLVTVDYTTSHEFSLGVDLGFNDFIYSYAGGLSYSRNVSNNRESLLDLNGDGLLDHLREDGGTLWVGFNTGNGFGPEVRWGGASLDAISKATSNSLGAGLFVTIPIPIFLCSPATVLFLIVNPGVMGSAAMARQESAILDVDGDQCPDYVQSSRDDELIVARNLTGRTNLLWQVQRPLGGGFALDYQRQGNTPEMPQSLWTLARVELSDGVADDGPSPLITTCTYRSPNYDRSEREACGFAEVREEHRAAGDPAVAYRVVDRTYLNDSYYDKGLIRSDVTRDGTGRSLRGAEFHYQFRDVATQSPAAGLDSRTATIFPMMVSQEAYITEAAAGAALSSQSTFEYDAIGNVVRTVDLGGPGPEDDLETTITYAACPGSNLLSRPSGIVARSNGVMLAERQGMIDCATGDLLQIRERLSDGQEAITDLAYSPAGLLTGVTGPLNLHGQRYQLHYQYDSRVATHATRIEDSFGLVSLAGYDLRFGRVTSTTDPNGNEIAYAYDPFGRTRSVTGPYETGAGTPTIEFEYHPDDPIPWARTRHLDVLRGPQDPIETVVFADGLGRILQTKVDGTVHASPTAAPADVMVVSGRRNFDAFGRAVEQYQPVTEPLGQGPRFNPTYDGAPPSRIEYDVLDRPVVVTQPDQTTTRYRYALVPDRSGALEHETTITDGNGHERRLHRDAHDLLVGVQEGAGAANWTSFGYDPLDRLVSVTDALQNVTRMEYDALGRRTLLARPDAGITRYDYDLASNLVAQRTANFPATGIRYDYDYRRLRSVQYPPPSRGDDKGDDDDGPAAGAAVTYEYGGPGAPDNGAGNLVRITDQAGIEQRFYGKLGEVIRQDRSITGERGWPAGGPPVFTTRYRYDTWGRLLGIVYPDQESLSYDYDSGGLVRSATGSEAGVTHEYVRRLEYDKFQQRAFLELGNGVQTTFGYRPLDQRLDRIQTVSAAGMFQNQAFTYDAVGNVLSVANEVAVPSGSLPGGPTVQRFEYDDLYRLTGATGTHTATGRRRTDYTLALRYDAIHNLVEMNQSHVVVNASGRRTTQRATSFSARYTYSPTQPHAATRVGSQRFTFDANGNLTGVSGGSDDDDDKESSGGRRLAWDAENRMTSVSDGGRTTRFAYDAAGARMLKKGPQGVVAYVNQFFTVRNRTIGTKHIYVGDTRIASRIARRPGSGSDDEGDDDDEDDPGAGTDPVFFYHPDHLGSVQFVTDAAGQVLQHLEYFPFGAVWVDQERGGGPSDLRFSGRELDAETGLYYFGARYQDPRLGRYLSVDPMSGAPGEKLAAASPAGLNVYAYAFDNPVRLVDPTGLEPNWWSGQGHTEALFHGAGGPSVAGPRGPPATPSATGATDSPSRVAAATGGGDFVAGAGAGVIDTGPAPASGISVSSERASSVASSTPGARGPPTSPATAAATAAAPSAAALEGEAAPSAGRRAPVILGENMMGRVIPYAKSVGGETIVDWLAGREWSQQLNDDYIAHIRATGRHVIDIGPDLGRRLGFKLNPPTDRKGRPVYEGERQQLRGYGNYEQVFIRHGRFGGGVPGHDAPAQVSGNESGLER